MKRYSPIKQKSAFWPVALLAKGQMLVETDLDGSVWNFPAGNRNPGLNRDGPDGFLAGFGEAGGRLLGGSGGGAPPAKVTIRLFLVLGQ